MNLILLSGGSGKRLWPLSNDIRSKQFIKIFKNGSGEYESMVQKVYRQITNVDKDSKITIATSKSQISSLNNQLGDKINISVEPCRRDTFPAITLATAYLHDVMHVSEDEAVIVCPVDSYVEDSFFETVKKLGEIAQNGEANLVLMGMEPTYPSEKYGYIIPESKDSISKVSCFKEKPDAKIAEDYISQGALWNGGVFAYKLGYVLNKAHELIEFENYYDLFEKYEDVLKISFDYAVVEHEDNIKVVRYSGEWKDLGTWNTLTEVMSEHVLGNAILNDTCENIHILNELDIPVLCMGAKDLIVSCSPQGILVSTKKDSSYIKPYVDKISQPIMFAEKSWGEYKVIDVQQDSLTVKVTLYLGHQMNYHSHERRDEVWTITSGIGIACVNGRQFELHSGDTLKLPKGCKHTIYAETDLELIEVQIGKDIDVKDKIKYTLEDN